MKVTPYAFTCKIEDLTTIAGFIKTSYFRDQAIFAAYSPDFDPTYLSLFEAEITAADVVIVPKTFTHELKQITQRMYANMDSLQAQLKLLKGYTIRVGANLSVQPADFGFPALQLALRRRSAESALNLLKITLKHVDSNLVDLQAKGFTPAARSTISDLLEAIKTDNLAQNAKINERGGQIHTNAQTLNTLWTRLHDVMSTGKILFDKELVKKQEYTMSALKKRINPERKVIVLALPTVAA